jgi:putative transposase
MAENGIQCSLSRSGNLLEQRGNGELLLDAPDGTDSGQDLSERNAARFDLFDYIERFYNPRRRQSTRGYLSPIAFEERHRLT